VTWVKTNITDELDVSTSFEQPWPESVAKLPLTVFHTAAAIRPQDRLKMFLPYCSKVNIDGTRNVMNAAKKAGASCFVSTSSGSVSLHKPNFWIAPWSKLPSRVVQILSDDAKIPSRHDHFFGNYAVTKIEAERLVRSADSQSSNFRTGCIRPANGIYGIGSDAAMTITGVYLRKGGSPTWVRPIIQSFVNAENVSIAHLLYEQRLLEQSKPGSTLPNIGGQAFVVTDPNPAISFNDIYTLLTTLSKTPVDFPTLQPAPLLAFSYLVELYCVIQHKYLPWMLPKVTGDLAQMQPSLFAISDVFCLADDARARKAPEQGGLGYAPPITTLEGMCKQLVDWNAKAEAKLVGVSGKSTIEITEKGVDVNLVAPEKKI
jgi:nucleoside-diphosphate-sugar epimerase